MLGLGYGGWGQANFGNARLLWAFCAATPSFREATFNFIACSNGILPTYVYHISPLSELRLNMLYPQKELPLAQCPSVTIAVLKR